MLTFSIDDKEVHFYSVNELPLHIIDNLINTQEPLKKGRDLYNPLFCTFDIETTTIDLSDGSSQAFMYCWQANLFGNFNVFGRTWYEWRLFLDLLLKSLPPTQKIVTYIHNASFEFQFLRDFVNITSVFMTDKRKIVTFDIDYRLEFRCSYKLSNMSLAKFIENTPNAKYNKQSGDNYNYRKIRTATHVMSDEELTYCFCDVAGLYEAIVHLMNLYGDTIVTIPLTSTGYVRREARKAFKSNKKNTIKYLELTPEEYTLLKTARRGGNSHCNPLYSDEKLDNLKSMDMSSAYPAVMIQCKFPMSKFWKQMPFIVDEKTIELNDKWAYIMEIDFYNIELKELCTIPYLPTAKATSFSNIKPDNGRVLKADKFGLCLTDIDFKIISKQYKWEKLKVINSYASRYDYLWDEYRYFIQKSYIKKCDLKGGDKYLYNKEKNKINALFGMMLTDIVHSEFIYDQSSEEPYKVEHPDLIEGLHSYYKNPNSFVHYAHGVWTTAHCRSRLQKAIELLGDDIVYCDTDSVKYIAYNDYTNLFSSLNEQIDKETQECGIETTYTNEYGTFTLGHWEPDGDYKQFKSLGAKKYCYIDTEDNFRITVAGLSKVKGRDYLLKHGGIDAFKIGTIVPPIDSGRTASTFNDLLKPKKIKIQDETIEIRSNIAIKDVSYTFGLAQDYADLLDEIHNTYKNDI